MTLLESIKSHGYWEVVIRPTRFNEHRVQTLSELEKIALASQVRMRGWPFPCDERGRLDRFEDHVSSEVDFMSHRESWRFYRSGLFVWFKANRWDVLAEDEGDSSHPGRKIGERLSVGDTLYLLCEFFEFASRLALSGAGDQRMHVDVSCHGIADRFLEIESWHDTRGRHCAAQSWTLSGDYSQTELVADGRKLAFDAASELFQLFSWDVSIDVLESIHSR
jgi:hypothetical protein